MKRFFYLFFLCFWFIAGFTKIALGQGCPHSNNPGCTAFSPCANYQIINNTGCDIPCTAYTMDPCDQPPCNTDQATQINSTWGYPGSTFSWITNDCGCFCVYGVRFSNGVDFSVGGGTGPWIVPCPCCPGGTATITYDAATQTFTVF
jgi:hypothetical protein